MVYKRYVRKNGKVHGPYYYESYRVGNKVKKRYIGQEIPRSDEGFGKGLIRFLIVGLIVLLVLFLGYFYISQSFSARVIDVGEGGEHVSLAHEKIVLNEEVKWTARVYLDSPERIGVEIPSGARIERITAVDSDREEDFGRGIFSGNVILKGNSKEYIVEYYTGSPISVEEKTDEGKRVIISGPENLNYTDVVAFSSIDDVIDINRAKEEIRILWIEEKRHIDFNVYDKNGNGKADFVEWVVPHLSNQTFEIILITDAQHLDSNKNFVENIYSELAFLDSSWKIIPEGDYVRINFEKNLTSENDISIYARSSEGGGVGVFTTEGIKIEDFGLISEDKKYRILLSNLTEKSSVFDLYVYGGAVEFNYVFDPSANDSMNVVFQCGDIDAPGVYTVNQSLYSDSDCLNILSSSVTINGMGYSIDGNDGIGADWGISAVGLENVRIYNFSHITDFGDALLWGGGISVSDLNHSSIDDLALSSNYGYGIYINGGVNNTIRNVNMSANSGIGIASYNQIGSGFENVNVSGSSHGIYVAFGTDLNFTNTSSFSNTGVAGITMYNSSHSSIIDSNFVNNSNAGIYLLDSNFDNIFLNVKVTSNRPNGIILSEYSENNSFINVEFVNNSGLDIDDTSKSTELNYISFNNSYGEIKWTDSELFSNLTFDGNLAFGKNVSLLSNFSEIVSDSFVGSRINSGANVTLRGLITTFVNPVIYKDGVVCSDCYNFTSLNAGDVLFNVSSWSSYSVRGDSYSPPDGGSPGGGGSGGGGGGDGGGSDITSPCEPVYSCSEWGICIGGIQTRVCDDTECNSAQKIETMECEDTECISEWKCSDWTSCAGGVSERVCEDLNSCLVEENKPTESVSCGGANDGLLNLNSGSSECISDVSCGEYGQCSYDSNPEKIMDGKIEMVGWKERVCSDSLGCVRDYVEKSGCKSIVPLEFSKDSFCAEDKLVGTNKDTGVPSVIVSIGSWEEEKLDLSFIQEKSVYCSSCYNEIKDDSEEGVDCGGECYPCREVEVLLLPLWVFVFMILSVFVGIMFLKSSDE